MYNSSKSEFEKIMVCLKININLGCISKYLKSKAANFCVEILKNLKETALQKRMEGGHEQYFAVTDSVERDVFFDI